MTDRFVLACVCLNYIFQINSLWRNQNKHVQSPCIPLTPTPSPRKEGKGKNGFGKPLPLYGGGVWGGGHLAQHLNLTLYAIELRSQLSYSGPRPLMALAQENALV